MMSDQDQEYREPGALPYRYWVVQDESSTLVDGGLIEESLVSIYVNGQELATIMCRLPCRRAASSTMMVQVAFE